MGLPVVAISPRELHPNKKVNRRRRGCNKLPLYSYHVLNVDGNLWAAPENKSEDPTGLRSHFRRGHVRRLQDPPRKVWVRATLVHGSRPGFVDKDYQVNMDPSKVTML